MQPLLIIPNEKVAFFVDKLKNLLLFSYSMNAVNALGLKPFINTDCSGEEGMLCYDDFVVLDDLVDSYFESRAKEVFS